jgi:hypothetical protein
LSATFGGDQVKTDIGKLFPSSTFLKVSQQQQVPRKLDIIVEGNLDGATIITKSAGMACEQALGLPVIIFHRK